MSELPRVVTFGETMALLYNEAPHPLQHAQMLTLAIGGAESNVAVALQRLGIATTWIGRVGNDSLGEKVARELRAEGVGVHAIVDSEAPTGLMIKERRTADATRLWYYRTGSAGSRLAAADIEPHLLASAALLHVTGITPALSESAYAATVAALEHASSLKIPVAFDVNHRSYLAKGRDLGPMYRELAGRATIVFAGEDEARLLVPTATSIPELARGICALGPTQAIIKLAERGCYALIDGTEFQRDSLVIRPIDTVGAGDAFVAGYLSELVLGNDVQTRLTTAVTAGAFACLVHGDWEGMPRRDELDMFGSAEQVRR